MAGLIEEAEAPAIVIGERRVYGYVAEWPRISPLGRCADEPVKIGERLVNGRAE